MAKLASDLEKPDGFVVVDPQRVQEFLDQLPASRLWGVGRVTSQALERLGVQIIADVRRLPEDVLQQHFGAHGTDLWRLSHGQDDRPVVPDRSAQSISHETTFAQDIEDLDVLRAWVVELAEQVAFRLRRNELRGRTIHLKIRYGDFHTITRAHTLPAPTDATQDICDAATELLSKGLPNRRLSVRLLGVGVSGLAHSPQVQQQLFDANRQAVQSNLDRATDQIRARFGTDALRRASGLLHQARHEPMPRPRPDQQ